MSRLRPLDPSVSSPAQGLAQLCSLAHIKVPELEEDFGQEAAEFLFEIVGNKDFLMKVEEKDTTGGKVKGQGSGPLMIVTLIEKTSSKTIQSLMLEVSFPHLMFVLTCYYTFVLWLRNGFGAKNVPFQIVCLVVTFHFSYDVCLGLFKFSIFVGHAFSA